MSDPTFTIEDDKVGLGCCVVAQWQDGHREIVTGFEDQTQAARWIEIDSRKWLLDIRRRSKRRSGSTICSQKHKPADYFRASLDARSARSLRHISSYGDIVRCIFCESFSSVFGGETLTFTSFSRCGTRPSGFHTSHIGLLCSKTLAAAN